MQDRRNSSGSRINDMSSGSGSGSDRGRITEKCNNKRENVAARDDEKNIVVVKKDGRENVRKRSIEQQSEICTTATRLDKKQSEV